MRAVAGSAELRYTFGPVSANAMGIGSGTSGRIGRLLLAAAFLAAGCTTGSLTDPESPVFFDIGGNDQKVIVSFGAGIAAGEGSPGGVAYLEILRQLLFASGRPAVRILDESVPGTTSTEGSGRIGAVLARDRPAVLLLLYGENDEAIGLPAGAPATQREDTMAALRATIAAARANRTLVVVSTLPPVCGDSRSIQRDRTAALNEQIRGLVLEMAAGDLGVVLVDAWRDFLAAAPPDGCALIGSSGERPDADGYATLVATWAGGLKNIAW